jgi:hypothetical protein
LIGIERVALRACRRVPDHRHAVKPARWRAPFGFGALTARRRPGLGW